MSRPHLLKAVAMIVLASLAGCKILPTLTAEQKAAATSAAAFDPGKMVADEWAAKMLPYLQAKAGPFADVASAAKADAQAAGQKFGNPKKQANSPWTYVASADGKIVAANTESRAATIDVDVDGDGKADLRAQIGPALRGTALRDALDYVDFNAFKNQIDFAQYGKAFNTYANDAVLSTLPRDGLVGKNAKLLGAFVAGTGDDLPLMTPAQAEIGP